jgi:murein DD-endopeptidase MepM/ murein hydrolase activator NlpD
MGRHPAFTSRSGQFHTRSIDSALVRGGRVGALGFVALLCLCGLVQPALAQESPSPSQTQSPSPSQTPSESPTPDPSPSPSTDPSHTPSPSPTGDVFHPRGGGGGHQGAPILRTRAHHPARSALERRRQRRERRQHDVSWTPDARWGAYSTAGLVRVARRLERKGWSARKIDERVYAPFPVGGLAAWTDTWGAPRYAGGYHPHHGQDLMCTEGTPLLAVEPGTVEQNSDPLGGITIYLVRPDGSFWYYAHLSRYANGVTDGDHVTTGQVIGRCGASGDATVSHLHFSHYSATGVALDPMHDLVGWLHDAERTSGAPVSNGKGVHLPKPFTGGEVGAEPAQPAVGTDLAGGTLLSSAATPITPSDMVVVPANDGAGFGMALGAMLLLLPLPLASRRVRERVLAFRNA